jgi:hypothetical protein
MKRLLVDPAVVGMAPTCVRTLLDKDNIQELYEAIDAFSNEAEDTLLFYYTGHGLIGRNSSELHLATAGTIEAQAESNALSFDKIRHTIQNSSARTKILILDCCFSGRAFEFMGPVSEVVQANLDLRGTFAIASSPPNRPALAPAGAKFTAFTGELVRVLNEGIDNGRDEISLEELYGAVRSAMKKRPNLPEPRRANFEDADTLQIARNAWSRVPRLAPGRLDYSALVPVLELPAEAEVFSVAVSADNRTIAAGSNGVVLLWRGEIDVHAWTSVPEPRRITDVHERFVYAVAFLTGWAPARDGRRRRHCSRERRRPRRACVASQASRRSGLFGGVLVGRGIARHRRIRPQGADPRPAQRLGATHPAAGLSRELRRVRADGGSESRRDRRPRQQRNALEPGHRPHAPA